MGIKSKVFRSTVADLIDFEPDENPPWRKDAHQAFSSRKMIEEIIEKRRKLDMGNVARSDDIKRRLEAKFFYHCNVEEGHGLQSVEEIEKFLGRIQENVSKDCESFSKEEQETFNLIEAYSKLKEKSAVENQEYRGLLEESLLSEVNKIILRNIPRNECYTKPGTYCNNPRVTQFRGETYYYQQPDDMQEAACVLLDRFNSLLTQSRDKMDEVDELEGVFKSVAWLMFELLDLHPFSDGNGRLCRLLCSYVLAAYTPFPSPIYNMYAKSSKQDFENALVAARKSEKRYPCELTTMIIESNLASWRKMDELVKEHEHVGDNYIPMQTCKSEMLRKSCMDVEPAMLTVRNTCSLL